MLTTFPSYNTLLQVYGVELKIPIFIFSELHQLGWDCWVPVSLNLRKKIKCNGTLVKSQNLRNLKVIPSIVIFIMYWFYIVVVGKILWYPIVISCLSSVCYSIVEHKTIYLYHNHIHTFIHSSMCAWMVAHFIRMISVINDMVLNLVRKKKHVWRRNVLCLK